MPPKSCMAEGWILLHKKILSWEWYQDVNTCKLFMHLLLKANYKENTWQGQTVRRGELISSREKLAIETGLTVQQTRTAEMKLQSTNDITIQSTNRFTMYFIVKYEDYQPDNSESTSQITNKPTSQQQTNNKRNAPPATTTKEVKEIKEKEISKKEPEALLFAEAEIQFSYDWLPDVKNIFDEFKKMRKNKKKPLTEYAERLALKQLDEFKKQGASIKEIIEQSILRGWDTFYPLKTPDTPTTAAPARGLSYQEQKELKHQQALKEGEKLYEQHLAEQSK